MAYTEGALHLRAGAPGDLTYTYDAGSDALATVLTAGYFNNTDDLLNLTVDDLIFIQAGDGNCWARVSAITSGSVTLQFAGGNLPVNTMATGTDSGVLVTLSVGYYEVGSENSTASRGVLPTPYGGAEVIVRKIGSGTQALEFDAGGSGATSITYDGTSRRITLRLEGEGFHVVGSSTTRWRLNALNLTATGKDGSYAGEGASNSIGGS